MKNFRINEWSFTTVKLQAKMRSILAIIALVAVIGFSMIACGGDDGTGGASGGASGDASGGAGGGGGGGDNGGGGGDAPSNVPFTALGTFTYNDNPVSFQLWDAATGARAVTVESYAVSGKLEDGDLLFNLKGTYDPVERVYSVSAASSLIRYALTGFFDKSGQSTNSKATVAVKSGDDWTTYNVDVTKKEVTIVKTDTSSQITEGEIPAFALGWWKYTMVGNEVKGKTLLSPWTINSYEDGGKGAEESEAVLSVTPDGSGYIVVSATVGPAFLKCKVTPSDNNTKMKCAYYVVVRTEDFGSWEEPYFESLDEAKEATKVSTEIVMNLTR